MPSRFPYGISYITPGSSSDKYTFTAGDTTPSVALGTVWFTNATSAVTLTHFDGGELGKVIYLYSSTGSVTTLLQGSGIIFTSSATNLVMGSNQLMSFLNVGNDKWIELVPRNV